MAIWQSSATLGSSKRRGLRAILALVAVGCLVPPALAADKKPNTAPVRVAAAAPKAVAQASGGSPASIEGRLRSGMGARGAAKGLTILPIRQTVLLDSVIGQNHDIRVSAESIQAADALVDERQASFYPTFTASTSYALTKTRERKEWITRPRDADPFADTSDETNTDPDAETQTTSDLCHALIIDGEEIPTTCPFKAPVTSTQEEWASYDSPHTTVIKGSVGLSWLAPWGTQTSFSLGLKYNKKYWFQFSSPPFRSILSSDDPYGLGDPRFWTSSASIGLSTPLPFTKGFGVAGSAAGYSWRLAETGARIARWNEQVQRNAIVSQALLGYWDLVLGAERLKVIAGHRALLNEQAARAKRLSEAQQLPGYSVNQIDAALVALDRQEEDLWAAYLVTSTQLTTLMAGDRKVVLLPVDGEELAAREAPEPPANTGFSLDTHPTIRAAIETQEASRVTLDYAEIQARPDLSLNMSFSLSQSDTTLGYSSAWSALSNLSKPDTSNFYVGIQYVLPFGNNRADAARSRARMQEAQAADRVLQARQNVTIQAATAANTLGSANAQVAQSARDVDLAGFAYDRAVDQAQLGQVSQFEVLRKLDDLLSAKLNRIAAKVEAQKARIRLLYAQGTLLETIGGNANATGEAR